MAAAAAAGLHLSYVCRSGVYVQEPDVSVKSFPRRVQLDVSSTRSSRRPSLYFASSEPSTASSIIIIIIIIIVNNSCYCCCSFSHIDLDSGCVHPQVGLDRVGLRTLLNLPRLGRVGPCKPYGTFFFIVIRRQSLVGTTLTITNCVCA